MNIKEVKSYIINLDLEPEKRWTKVILDHKQHFPRVVKEIDTILKSAGILGGLSKVFVGLFASLGNIMYKKELEAISLLSDVPMNKLVLMQICYEMFSACTSIVIRGKNRNYHFRTMDWEMGFLRNLTINVTFVKGGKELYKATTWAGYVGVVTGTNREYSLALNYRRSNGTLIGNVIRTMGMKWPVGYLIRYVFDNNMDYDQAYTALCTYKLISPCYITMCRFKDSAKIIVRNHDKLVDFRQLTNDVNNGYLIQTNHDVNENGDCDGNVNIMWSFERYKHALDVIQEKYNFDSDGVCNQVDIDQVLLMKNLMSIPIINPHTIYASLIVPEQFTLESFVVI